ncbi:S41 family peptidase, partial [Acinetobacter baumannii]|uniref:S41 family peptidase n=1 Tax=Acinetobacter baumannii TaxID=470 RepID=UPI000A7122DE
DHKAGTLIGAKTFGKGVVQELVPLEKGGILKLTVEEYFSPKMHKINGQGIVPDITVEDGDAQLMKAISYLHGSTALHL